MKFEWDESKNQKNFSKHNIWFEEAQTVWTDSFSVELIDPYLGQDRLIKIGYSTKPRLLFVVFSEQDAGEMIRIISARNLTKKERMQYEEGI